jgi:hypothetical protein
VKRRRHKPESVIRNLADGGKLLGSGKDLDAIIPVGSS